MEQTLPFIYFHYYNSFRPYHSFGILLSRSAELSDSVVCCVVSGTEDALISDTSCQSVQTETYLHFRPPPLDPICHPDFLKINLDTVWIWHTTDLGLKGLGDVNFISSRVGSGYLQVVMTVLNCHLGHNGTISYKICLCMCGMRPQSGNMKVVEVELLQMYMVSTVVGV